MELKEIKCKFRRNDRDLVEALDKLNLLPGERSDLVRVALRRILEERGLLKPVNELRFLDKKKSNSWQEKT